MMNRITTPTRPVAQCTVQDRAAAAASAALLHPFLKPLIVKVLKDMQAIRNHPAVRPSGRISGDRHTFLHPSPALPSLAFGVHAAYLFPTPLHLRQEALTSSALPLQ